MMRISFIRSIERRGAVCTSIPSSSSSPCSVLCYSYNSPMWAYNKAGGRRFFGVFDRVKESFQQRTQEKQNEKQGELFKAQVDYLLTVDHYGMREHITMLRDIAKIAGVDGWKSYFRTTAQQREIEQSFQDLKVAEGLTDEELDDPSLITRRAKLRIAGDTGVEVSAVNRLLKQYQWTKDMHHWVHHRHQKGLPLPKTAQEYQRLVMESQDGLPKGAVKRMMGKQQKRQKGMTGVR